MNIAQMFLNGTKPAIFYTRCYMLFLFRKYLGVVKLVDTVRTDGLKVISRLG